MNVLFCGLNKKEYNKVSLFQPVQEICFLLEITDESTNQVKESKISNLTHKYELFQNKDGRVNFNYI